MMLVHLGQGAPEWVEGLATEADARKSGPRHGDKLK
jgi:hypothetical protein